MHQELLRTKLNPPGTGSLHFRRERLVRILEAGASDPFVLVSAPAGFGKTTLVSDWLSSCDRPHAWLSIDERDGDLRQFLRYIVAAVRTAIPDALPTMALTVRDSPLPPVDTLCTTLSNELEDLDTPITLVIDDFHRLGSSPVHELMAEIVTRPPRPLRLILISRFDPPLPLATLRAHGWNTEVRAEDLRFTRSESAHLLRELAGGDVGDNALGNLEHQNDGWAAGLQMIAVSLRGRDDADAYLRNLQIGQKFAREFLAREVLDVQSEDLRNWLLRASIAERFCAPLCEAVQDPNENQASGMSGEDFLATLEERGLFVIPMDATGRWYRFHHLFRDLLRSELAARWNPESITELHERASRWFAEQGLVEEALDHALMLGDPALAVELVAENRHAAMNQEDWHRLGAWLDRLPAGSATSDPRIMLARGWHLCHIPRFEEALSLIEDVRALPAETRACHRGVEGEIEAMDGLLGYIGQGVFGRDRERVIRHCEKALLQLPADFGCIRGYATYFLSLSHALSGQGETARTILWRAMEEDSATGAACQARVRSALAHVLFRAGDLRGTLVAAQQQLDVGSTHDLPETVQMARSTLGWSHYLRGEIDQAEEHFKAGSAAIGASTPAPHAESHIGLALSKRARGDGVDARESIASLTASAIARGASAWIEHGRLYQAEIALLDGRTAEAQALLKGIEKPRAFGFYYDAELTIAKARLADGGEAALSEAVSMLEAMRLRLEDRHDIMRLGPVLAVEALVHRALGEETAAISFLEASLAATEIGEAIQPYLDLGAPMAALMRELPSPACDSEHARRILAASSGESDGQPATTERRHRPEETGLIEPLTNRELDVLELLAERYRDKEIAEKLVISPGTVRSHLKRVYGKLGVSGRREAVARAQGLGLI